MYHDRTYTLYQPSTARPSTGTLPATYQYFRDADFHSVSHAVGAVSHCDARFALRNHLEIDELQRTLSALLASYVTTIETLGILTWVAHGALLRWYWNQKFLPWDTDVDVQIPAESLAILATSYNMTTYRYAASEAELPRTYLLDINPHYLIVSEQDVANKIDGRWIDTTNGKFIDITAVHVQTGQASGYSNFLVCKDGHKYNGSREKAIKSISNLLQNRDLYPLQRSFLQGTPVNVPSRSEKVLEEEYGRIALTTRNFHW